MNTALTMPRMSEVASNATADLADANFSANLAALADHQPGLPAQIQPLPGELTWLFGRDGSLTGILDKTRWWAGCSVPLAAARFMLKSMEVRGTVGCILNPLNASQLRVALGMLNARQAVVALVPEEKTLAVLLHAEDFSADIRSGRLWFAAGAQWESELRSIFRDEPGLPTPVEFIRPITADAEATNALIEPAQRVFAEVSASRGTEIKTLCENWQPRAAKSSFHNPSIEASGGGAARLPFGCETASRPTRLCLLAPTEFRLWDDAALALAEMDLATAGISVTQLDSDRPTSSSPMALGRASAGCDAVLTTNVFRSHLPGVVPLAMPWITWVTSSRICPATEAGPNDRLLLADPSWQAAARELGWDESKMEVAGWPKLPLSSQPARQITVLADTHVLDVPKGLEEYSSQVLLWELIRDELWRDPFLAVDNIDGYLNSRRARFQIGDDGFDRSVFINGLIMPAVQQGIVKRLIRDEIPVRLFGRRWDAIDGFADFHGGIVASRAELTEIVSASAALVHLWPWQTGHAVEALGRPVVRCRRVHEFLSDARAALNGTLRPPTRPMQTICPELIARHLTRAASHDPG